MSKKFSTKKRETKFHKEKYKNQLILLALIFNFVLKEFCLFFLLWHSLKEACHNKKSRVFVSVRKNFQTLTYGQIIGRQQYQMNHICWFWGNIRPLQKNVLIVVTQSRIGTVLYLYKTFKFRHWVLLKYLWK